MEEYKEQPPPLYYKVDVPIGVIAPDSNLSPTPQDNRALLEEQAKQIAELTALVQSLLKK
jgi:hypothetical protein